MKTEINKNHLIIILILAGTLGIAVGFAFGYSNAINLCVNTGLKIFNLDSVHISFSDGFKALIKLYESRL